LLSFLKPSSPLPPPGFSLHDDYCASPAKPQLRLFARQPSVSDRPFWCGSLPSSENLFFHAKHFKLLRPPTPSGFPQGPVLWVGCFIFFPNSPKEFQISFCPLPVQKIFSSLFRYMRGVSSLLRVREADSLFPTRPFFLVYPLSPIHSLRFFLLALFCPLPQSSRQFSALFTAKPPPLRQLTAPFILRRVIPFGVKTPNSFQRTVLMLQLLTLLFNHLPLHLTIYISFFDCRLDWWQYMTRSCWILIYFSSFYSHREPC